MKKKEITLDIRDLFAEMIRKCWLIAALTLICAVLVTAAKYKKDLQNLTEQENIVDTPQVELTEEEVVEVEKYIVAVSEKDSVKGYIENSVLLKCDSYNVYTVIMNYTFTELNEEDEDVVAFAYENYITSGMLANDMAIVLVDYDTRIVKEIVNLRSGAEENVNVISIQIVSDNETNLAQLIDVLKTQMSSFEKKVNENYALHKLTLIEEKTFTQINESIIDLRTHRENQYKAVQDKVTALENELTNAQKIVANEKLDEENKLTVSEQDENKTETVKVGISISYLVIGAAVGFIVAVFYIMIVYFFSSTVKTRKEIQDVYDIPLLGTCSVVSKNVFEKLAQKIVYPNETKVYSDDYEYLLAKMSTFVKNNGYEKCYLVGKLSSKEADVLKKLTEDIKSCKIEILGDILKNADCINSISKDTNIVLVNTIRKTEYGRVEEELKTCGEMKANIIGYISFVN